MSTFVRNDLHRSIESIDLTIILPCYNERENLPKVVALLYKSLNKLDVSKILELHKMLTYEIIIVDDNSPDKTADIAKQLLDCFSDMAMALLIRSDKQGLGTAYVQAAQLARGDRICILDSDLSHNPKEIPNMLQKMHHDKLDIVYGSRYEPGGGVFGWPLHRVMMSVLANFFWHMLMGTSCTDGTGSFRIYKSPIFLNLCKNVINTGFGFQLEVITRGLRNGLKIDSVPIQFVNRVYGESKMTLEELRRWSSAFLTMITVL